MVIDSILIAVVPNVALALPNLIFGGMD
jgi:hypothetical protein